MFGRTETLLGIRVTGPEKYYYLLLGITLLIVLVCVRLQNSRIGRAWEANREDEIAAKAMGINTRNVKLLAFALGASFGGVARSEERRVGVAVCRKCRSGRSPEH